MQGTTIQNFQLDMLITYEISFSTLTMTRQRSRSSDYTS